MENPIDHFWKLKPENVKEALESNNFEVFIADNASDVTAIVQDNILSSDDIKSMSWGGSMTFVKSGLYEDLKTINKFDILDTYDKSLSNDDKTEMRRQALLTDLFITGTNAVTEDGFLVNLDMIGNRIGGLTFGPKNVLVLVGRNKIVADVESAVSRIKEYVAPANAIRLDMKTPCVQTGECADCKSSARICNTWTITEKSFPKKRVKVILINEDMGL
jgi:L-lactate utilization protein LutB